MSSKHKRPPRQAAPGKAQESIDSGSNYNNIPAELSEGVQWVCANQNKVPVNPKTGSYASVTDPTTWSTFDEVVSAGSEIGRVFTKDDPYVGIDLDPKTPEQEEHCRQIVEAFDSYTETSRSGNGAHIIVRGEIPHAVKRDHVEIYDTERYFIFTGKAFNGQAIHNRQELIDTMVTAMGSGATNTNVLEQLDSDVPDDQVLDKVRLKSEKFDSLWRGVWKGNPKYPTQSEADHALLGFLAGVTRDNTQVRRLFRKSGLGQRPKAQRDGYLDNSLRQFRAEQALVDAVDFGEEFKNGPSLPTSQTSNLPPPPTPINSTQLQMVNAADVVPERVRWVWPGVLPRGKISIITGMAGTNKTTLGIDVTARISSRLRWPCGSIPASAGTVIFASGEDDAADTLVPRLIAAGATLGNVQLLTGITEIKNGKEFRRTFRLDHDMALLEQAVVTSKVTAVLIDPLSAFVGETETHTDASVRSLLEPLRHLAETYRVAVIGIMHPPKAQYAELVSMISGSAAFGNAARAVWLIARDPDDEDRRLMLPAKLNLASDRFGFAYRKVLVDVKDIGQQVYIEWDTERVEKAVALERMGQEAKPGKVAEARKFIVEYMQDKSICPAADITDKADASGINLSTLHKARKELGYETVRHGGRDGSYVWFPKKGWPLKEAPPTTIL